MAFHRFNKEEGLEHLNGLCNRFEKNIAKYRSQEYDEADTRQDLIEHLFLALGWDVHAIKAIDAQIDRLMYKLYGLINEEIKVMEG
ncbi:MAG: hypothetical protein ACUVWP_03840 [bacterium]